MREDQAAVGRPCGPAFVTRKKREALGRAAGDGDEIDVEAIAAIRGERDAPAVRRPRRIALDDGASRGWILRPGRRRGLAAVPAPVDAIPGDERTRVLAVAGGCPDLIDVGERDGCAVRRPRGIAGAAPGRGGAGTARIALAAARLPAAGRGDDQRHRRRQRHQRGEGQTAQRGTGHDITVYATGLPPPPRSSCGYALTSDLTFLTMWLAEMPKCSSSSSGLPLRGISRTARR